MYLVYLLACAPENTLQDATTPAAAGTDTADTGVQPNQPPSPPVLRIVPQQPSADDDLLCTIASPGVDPEGVPVSHTLSWMHEGKTYERDAISADMTTAKETWLCLAWASDALFGRCGRVFLAPILDRATNDQAWNRLNHRLRRALQWWRSWLLAPPEQLTRHISAWPRQDALPPCLVYSDASSVFGLGGVLLLPAVKGTTELNCLVL